MSRIIFPGSFDPITIGHLDLINRAAKIFDEVIVLITNNKSKTSLLNIENRKLLISNSLKEYKLENVEVETTNLMVVDFCEKKSIYLILRGLRNTSDLAFEHNMAIHNEMLNDKIETVCLLTKQNLFHVSSSSVREILSYKKDISHLVPNCVAYYFKEKNENL